MGTSCKHYVKIFFAHHGPGPYDCIFCHQPVTLEEAVVHHVDGNHDNNDPSNLSGVHHKCHARHHCTLMMDEAGRQRLSTAMKKRYRNPQERQRTSETTRQGMKKS